MISSLDINLWVTTLRFARTNEVSTINNSAIAASRIVNFNRSPNALIQFGFVTNISSLEGTRLEEFCAALERYVKDHPRTWEALAFVRFDEVDCDWEKIYMRLAFRHRNSWQDATRVLQSKGQLQRFAFELGKQMGINFNTAPQANVVYQGGEYNNHNHHQQQPATTSYGRVVYRRGGVHNNKHHHHHHPLVQGPDQKQD